MTELDTIDIASLDTVTGGRVIPQPAQIPPAVIQAIQELTQAVSAVGQNLAQASQANGQGMMQMMQQMMQARGGGPK